MRNMFELKTPMRVEKFVEWVVRVYLLDIMDYVYVFFVCWHIKVDWYYGMKCLLAIVILCE